MRFSPRFIFILMCFCLPINLTFAQDQTQVLNTQPQSNNVLLTQKEQIDTTLNVLKLQNQKLENQIGVLSSQLSGQNDQTSQGLEQVKEKIQAIEEGSLQSDLLVSNFLKEKDGLYKQMTLLYKEKGGLLKEIEALKAASLNNIKKSGSGAPEDRSLREQINASQDQLSKVLNLLDKKPTIFDIFTFILMLNLNFKIIYLFQ